MKIKDVKSIPNLSMTHPCIFRDRYTRTEINPRIQAEWREHVGGKEVPFGALQRIWREEHCQTINRWSSDDCPYPPTTCALAYLRALSLAVEETIPPVIPGERPLRGRSLARFSAKARFSGLNRLEQKPLARYNRTDVPQGPGPASPPERSVPTRRAGDDPGGLEAETHLSRSRSGPVRIGELLGQINIRPRQGRTENGQEGPE